MRFAMILIVVFVLSISFVSAKTLDDHINTLLEEDVAGTELPSALTWLINDGIIQIYVIPSGPPTTISDAINDSIHSIYLDVQNGKILSLAKGKNPSPSIVVVVSQVRALALFESGNLEDALVNGIKTGDPKYSIKSGSLGMKVNMIKYLGRILSLFSPRIERYMPLLEYQAD